VTGLELPETSFTPNEPYPYHFRLSSKGQKDLETVFIEISLKSELGELSGSFSGMILIFSIFFSRKDTSNHHQGVSVGFERAR
jgi:hypothetical protein